MKILVKGESTHEAITVRGGYWDNEGVFWLEWCNHAGAEVEDSFESYYDQGREQMVEWESKWLVCDKCEEATEHYE
jgi:hypothetical protein